MLNTDPIYEAEKIVKGVNDSASKYTQPVLKRYPLLFSLLIIFGTASILHGFELIVEKILIFQERPAYLILIGVTTLLFTGMLYKVLGKGRYNLQ